MKQLTISEITFVCDEILNETQITSIFSESYYFTIPNLSLYSILKKSFIDNFLSKGKVEILPLSNSNETFYFSLISGRLFIEFTEILSNVINISYFKKTFHKRKVSYRASFELETCLEKLKKIFTDFIQKEIPNNYCYVNFEPNVNLFTKELLPHPISLATFLDSTNFIANKYEISNMNITDLNFNWPEIDKDSEPEYNERVLDYISRMVFSHKNNGNIINDAKIDSDESIKLSPVNKNATIITLSGCFSNAKSKLIISDFHKIVSDNSDIMSIFVKNDLRDVQAELLCKSSQIHVDSYYQTREIFH